MPIETKEDEKDKEEEVRVKIDTEMALVLSKGSVIRLSVV